MPKKTTNRAADLANAQDRSIEHARNWLAQNSLHLPDSLSEAEFATVMNAVTKGLINAYAMGYMDARGPNE